MRDLRSKLVLGGLFGVAVVIGLLLYSDVRGFGTHIESFPTNLIVPILLLTLFNYLLRWLKWQYYLKVIGVTGLSRMSSAILWVAGFVLAVSPGKVAELLKAAGLRIMAGTPVARGAPVVIAERITDGLAMFILTAIGLGGILLSSSARAQLLYGYLPAYFTLLGIIIAVIILIQFRPVFNWLIGATERLPIMGRISHAIHEVYESSYELFRPVPLMIAVGIGVVSWAGECLGFFLILWGLGLSASWLLLWQATFILTVATILGGISGLPGGLGAAEVSIAFLIQSLILGHPDSALAGTATLLVRLCTLWFAVLLGMITAVAFRQRLFPPEMVSSIERPSVS